MATPYKRYQCNVWPEYRIRDLKFDQGILEVCSKRDSMLVEGADHFGILIWEIPLDESAVPVQDEVAHQGTQATEVTEVQTVGEVNVAVTPEAVLDDESDDEVTILGGGYYEYQGVKVRGKKNLPPEAQDLV
jgi:hypothetical protein